ncbi:alcohol dehydrogenase catalytic domain-containing protein [uncultured Eubacterium sp.]|nr:alcohol dehydrogenase catalytic domain-containing protein [uncultured Eubacterium sp.]MCI6537011.1 alcohol dehydrogenase catalytic domain-containing protein [Lachnospiraceae bacterium]
MLAVKYHGPKNLEYVDIPKPEVLPGTALVKIKYCGICGTDVHAYSIPGIFDWELVLGHESVGIVEAVGAGVDNVKVGDRVAVGPPGDCGKCYACNTGHPNVCANAFPETLGIGPNTQGAYAE